MMWKYSNPMAGPVRPGTNSARRTRRENAELKWDWWRLCDGEDAVRGHPVVSIGSKPGRLRCGVARRSAIGFAIIPMVGVATGLCGEDAMRQKSGSWAG